MYAATGSHTVKNKSWEQNLVRVYGREEVGHYTTVCERSSSCIGCWCQNNFGRSADRLVIMCMSSQRNHGEQPGWHRAHLRRYTDTSSGLLIASSPAWLKGSVGLHIAMSSIQSPSEHSVAVQCPWLYGTKCNLRGFQDMDTNTN
jgi:hypothetical protein